MSTLRANTILNPSTNSPILNPTGNVVQVARVRYQTRTTISSNNTGNGTTITGLNLTLTPRSSNNRIICQWYIMGELHHDNVFLIHRGGALITTSGEWGYNGDSGNNRWSGYIASTYDSANNNDSTPHNWFIQYSQIANTTVSTTWAPAVRSSTTSNHTLHINKNIGNAGSANRETGVSFGVIYEVTT